MNCNPYHSSRTQEDDAVLPRNQITHPSKSFDSSCMFRPSSIFETRCIRSNASARHVLVFGWSIFSRTHSVVFSDTANSMRSIIYYDLPLFIRYGADIILGPSAEDTLSARVCKCNVQDFEHDLTYSFARRHTLYVDDMILPGNESTKLVDLLPEDCHFIVL